MQFPIGTTNGQIAVGCFAQGTHQIINKQHCFIQHSDNNSIAQTVQQVVDELGISTYDEQTGQGEMRHVIGRVGTKTGEVMVVLVTATPDLSQKEILIERLREYRIS